MIRVRNVINVGIVKRVSVSFLLYVMYIVQVSLKKSTFSNPAGINDRVAPAANLP